MESILITLFTVAYGFRGGLFGSMGAGWVIFTEVHKPTEKKGVS